MTAVGEPVRLIEPGVTVFSAAEIRVVRNFLVVTYSRQRQAFCCLWKWIYLYMTRKVVSYVMQDDWPGTMRSTAVAHLQAIVPVGNMADDVFASYASLVTAFRQVSFRDTAER
jgi:hypothetical protein